MSRYGVPRGRLRARRAATSSVSANRPVCAVFKVSIATDQIGLRQIRKADHSLNVRGQLGGHGRLPVVRVKSLLPDSVIADLYAERLFGILPRPAHSQRQPVRRAFNHAHALALEPRAHLNV